MSLALAAYTQEHASFYVCVLIKLNGHHAPACQAPVLLMSYTGRGAVNGSLSYISGDTDKSVSNIMFSAIESKHQSLLKQI